MLILEKREQSFRRINLYIKWFFVILGVTAGIYNIFNSTPYYVMLAFASSLFAFVPGWFFRATRMKPIYSLAFFAYVFCFLAFTLGMVFAGMALIPYYDKFLHAISGIFFALVGLVSYYLLKHDKTVEKTDGPQAILFSISFTMLIAVIWEIFEYLINFVLHNDAQKVAQTGVNDTMQDIIVCLIGALIFSVSMHMYYKKGKRSLLMGVFEAFFEKNMK